MTQLEFCDRGMALASLTFNRETDTLDAEIVWTAGRFALRTAYAASEEVHAETPYTVLTLVGPAVDTETAQHGFLHVRLFLQAIANAQRATALDNIIAALANALSGEDDDDDDAPALFSFPGLGNKADRPM